MELAQKMGIPVVDADLLAREVTQDPQVTSLIIRSLGQGCIGPDGKFDRRAVLRIILKDQEARERLCAIIHPRVFELLDKRLSELKKKGKEKAFVEVPLLFEAGWDRCFDKILCVVSPESECIKRIIDRNKVDESVARAWFKAQMPQEEKAIRSHVVLVNDGDKVQLEKKARKVLDLLFQSHFDHGR